MLACAPLSDTENPAPNPDISFSVTAVASSVQFEVTSVPAVTDVGAVIRLAAEAAPTKTEAQASKGYVSLSIEADSTRKFSISQHYGSDFTDGGFTLADVLTPNTKYKLYLYMPSAIDLGQTVIKGGEVKEDRVEISFTTANLPVEGDVIWSNKWIAKEYVASLNEYYFMKNQTGIVVAYFQRPFTTSLLEELALKNPNGLAYDTIGTYVASVARPGSRSHYNSGPVIGYTSGYGYFIGADKQKIIETELRCAYTNLSGVTTFFHTPVSRH
ncbi:hypothetical protein P0082_03810 [Candidatus Haliotispira prima]|uniref:Uncharacterized protein n=1 Tax=Candidatus Haliotispira prima TaxID=3034016 RepID=A0ABY8MJ06_9SPIO|nr:hypothetical protein P0082_03810 [Candidatus Haliotispira prima]